MSPAESPTQAMPSTPTIPAMDASDTSVSSMGSSLRLIRTNSRHARRRHQANRPATRPVCMPSRNCGPFSKVTSKCMAKTWTMAQRLKGKLCRVAPSSSSSSSSSSFSSVCSSLSTSISTFARRRCRQNGNSGDNPWFVRPPSASESEHLRPAPGSQASSTAALGSDATTLVNNSPPTLRSIALSGVRIAHCRQPLQLPDFDMETWPKELAVVLANVNGNPVAAPSNNQRDSQQLRRPISPPGQRITGPQQSPATPQNQSVTVPQQRPTVAQTRLPRRPRQYRTMPQNDSRHFQQHPGTPSTNVPRRSQQRVVAPPIRPHYRVATK